MHGFRIRGAVHFEIEAKKCQNAHGHACWNNIKGLVIYDRTVYGV